MKSSKRFYSVLMLFSFISCFINGYDVKKFFPFGKTLREINTNIKLLAAQKVKVVDAINLHFEKQEKEIIDKLKTKYKISEADWKATQQRYERIIATDPLYKQHTGTIAHQPNDHPIAKKARELLVAYGMNPNAITIMNSDLFGTAAVNTAFDNNTPIHTMHLHIPELSMLSEAEYTDIIKHELMHLWFADTTKLSICGPLFASRFAPDTNPSNEPLILDYRKNFEMRADIFSKVHDANPLGGIATWFKKNTWTDQYNDATHPSFTERLDALKQLSSYLTEAKKYPAIAA